MADEREKSQRQPTDPGLVTVRDSMLDGLGQLAEYFGFSKVMGQLYAALLTPEGRKGELARQAGVKADHAQRCASAPRRRLPYLRPVSPCISLYLPVSPSVPRRRLPLNPNPNPSPDPTANPGPNPNPNPDPHRGAGLRWRRSARRSPRSAARCAPYISPYLPTPPHISPYLPISPCTSPHLPVPPHISPYLPISPHISLYLPTSACISANLRLSTGRRTTAE